MQGQTPKRRGFQPEKYQIPQIHSPGASVHLLVARGLKPQTLPVALMLHSTVSLLSLSDLAIYTALCPDTAAHGLQQGPSYQVAVNQGEEEKGRSYLGPITSERILARLL